MKVNQGDSLKDEDSFDGAEATTQLGQKQADVSMSFLAMQASTIR